MVDEQILNAKNIERMHPGKVWKTYPSHNELTRTDASDLYSSLADVLVSAYEQAKHGKGMERHASDDAFEDQIIVQIQDMVGGGFARGQAIKKIKESGRLATEPAVREILGAINYLAAYVIWLQKQPKMPEVNSGNEF